MNPSWAQLAATLRRSGRLFFLSDTAWVLLGNLGATLVGVVTGVATARVLGPDLRGDLAVILYWPQLLATLADLCIADSIVTTTASEPGRRDPAIHAGAILALLGSLVGVGAGVILLRLLLTGAQAHLVGPATLLLLHIPASLVAQVPIGALLGLQLFKRVAMVRLVSVLVYLAALLTLIHLDLTAPTLIALSTLLSPLTTCALAVAALPKTRADAVRSSVPLLQQARTGAVLHSGRLMAVASSLADRGVATRALSAREIGLYQVPATVATVAMLVPQSLSAVLFARLSAARPEDQPGLALRTFVRAITLSITVSVVALAVLPFAVPLLYGAAFSPAIPAAMAMLPGAIFSAAAGALQGAARAATRLGPPAQAEAMALLTVVVLGFQAGSERGALGLALAWSVSRAVALAWMVALVPTFVALSRSAMLPWSLEFRRMARADWDMLAFKAERQRPGGGA
ncbi:MAG: lipopolysaccharide biosynthesis protein [Anaeromyxobacteraceae bacterium]|nr:lipopolysaccharide biosynthesis protein [Anaeromyxobacteraceae bacterium]